MLLRELHRRWRAIERLADRPVPEARAGLRSIRGLGPWSEAMVAGQGLGDGNAVPTGDWNLPHVSGLELLRQIRASDPDLPFLMVTGASDRESVIVAKENGVTGYLAKPYSQDQTATT